MIRQSLKEMLGGRFIEKKIKSFLLVCSFILFGSTTAFAIQPVLLFSDITDGMTSGWENSSTTGAAVSIWVRNIGNSRGDSYVTVGGVSLRSDSDYAEWGVTTKPIVPLGMQRITFWLNSTMLTEGAYPNTTITVTTTSGTSNSIPFHCRELGDNHIFFKDNVSGSDSNDGLTVSSAKKTTAWARGNLKGGDICYLKGNNGSPYNHHDAGSGFHNGGLFSFGGGSNPNHNIGVEGMSISVAAYPGDLVEMFAGDNNGDTSQLRSCIYTYYAGSQLNYWTFSKFKMEASWAAISLQSAGFVTGGTSNIRFVGIDATTDRTTAGQWGNILVAYGANSGLDHLYIYGCYFHDQMTDFRGQEVYSKRAYQVYIGGYGPLDHIYMAYNEMGWGEQGRGLQIYGHLPTDSVDNLFIHHNWFHDNQRQCVILGGGDGNGTNYSFVKNCYFYNNIVSNPGVGWASVVVGGVGNGRYGGHFHIYNNTFHKSNDSYPTLNITGQLDSAILGNNIIIGSPNNWDYYTYYPDSVSPNLSGNNNLYFGCGDNAVPSWDTSELRNNDPQFVISAPENFYDFRLQSTSPARDSGSRD